MTLSLSENELAIMFNEYLAAWSTQDVERILSFFTDDCIYENLPSGAVYRGKEELKAWVVGTFAAIPDFSIGATSVFAGGKRIGCEWVMTGTHTGNLPVLPTTGKTFSVRGATIAETEKGKIKRNSDYWDMATFLRQLGVPNM
jgi:steroid delta-isomerase-like uncharacterized protein